MNWMRVAPLVLLGTACVPAATPEPAPPSRTTEVVQPVRATPTPGPTPTVTPTPSRPAVFTFDGALEQGGWIRGTVPGGTSEAMLGEEELAFDDEGRFFAAFDRDAQRLALRGSADFRQPFKSTRISEIAECI